MVLRRPYAFLIKHFRLIHLVITALFAIVALKCRTIYSYLRKVIIDTTNRYDAPSFIDYRLFIYILIALVFCYVVYWLLKYKDKPRKIYIFTIGGYILVSAFLFILLGYMGGFSSAVVDQKTIRLYRDILLIVLLFQYLIVLIMLIRGLGFDIKKFDFKRDVQELNTNESDSEEIEVNVGIDTTNVMRMVRKQGREFGYFFKEFKLYIIIILIIVIGFVGYRGYNYFSVKYKVYKENEIVGNINNIVVRDSYYSIDGNNNYVIINFDIYKNGVKERFNTGNMALYIGKDKYLPDKNVCYKFSSLGTCYKKQYIDNNVSNYLLSYAVDSLNVQDAYLIYTDSFQDNYKIKLILKEF